MTDNNDRLADIRADLDDGIDADDAVWLLSLVDQLQGQQADEIDRLNALVGMGETHLAKLERMKSQVAALIAAVSGLSIPEGKHSPDYRMGYADALGAARFTLGIAHPPAQDRASGPETTGGHPSEGPAPTGLPGAAQGPAPLTLTQAAGRLHDWAGDLDDGANTAWPAGHADVIRGIRAAADWLDARSAYETEVRQRATEPEETPTLADAIGGRRAANALAEAMATPSGHEPEEAHEEPPCIPVTVHTYGLTDTARNGLIDRVATAAHALDEDVSCTVGGTCPQCEPPEEAPEPTWRDVIRAMRAENIRLRPLYDIANWPADRTWQLIDHHGSDLGIVTHETSYAGEDWALALSYERGPSTRIDAEALEPTDVLAAARLAGLIGDTDA